MSVREIRRGPGLHTRICHADSNISALELAAVEGQSLLQTFQGSEFRIAESLWLHLQLILDNSHVGAFALSKEVGHIADCGIKREVAKVDRIWWLVG